MKAAILVLASSLAIACVPPAAQPVAPVAAPQMQQQLPTDPVCIRSPEEQTSWAADDKQITCDSSACKVPFGKPVAHMILFQGAQSIQPVEECWCCYEAAKPAALVPPPPPPARSPPSAPAPMATPGHEKK